MTRQNLETDWRWQRCHLVDVAHDDLQIAPLAGDEDVQRLLVDVLHIELHLGGEELVRFEHLEAVPAGHPHIRRSEGLAFGGGDSVLGGVGKDHWG